MEVPPGGTLLGICYVVNGNFPKGISELNFHFVLTNCFAFVSKFVRVVMAGF